MAVPSFKDNVVILTGASSGIGRAMALQLAEQGAWLVLAARSAPALEEVAAECRERGAKQGARTAIHCTDVTDKNQCRVLIETTLREFGRIDTLINNAGILVLGKFEDMKSLEPFDQIMKVNVLGPIYVTYYALPHLKETKGRLVGVSSLAGKSGVPQHSAYSASKHAVVGFFDTLRIELLDDGVTVTMVYPDFVESEIRERALGTEGRPLGGEKTMRYKNNKLMSANDCACLAIRGIARRQREVVTSIRGKFGPMVKPFVPGLIDRIALNAVDEWE